MPSRVIWIAVASCGTVIDGSMAIAVRGDQLAVGVDREIAGAGVAGLARRQRDSAKAAPIDRQIVRVLRVG